VGQDLAFSWPVTLAMTEVDWAVSMLCIPRGQTL
jgi:hypothetical protein